MFAHRGYRKRNRRFVVLMLFLAFLIAGAKFPFLGRGPRPYEIPADTLPRIREPGRWIHDLTNYAVELRRAQYREDAQYWTKRHAFQWLVAFVVEVHTVALLLWALL